MAGLSGASAVNTRARTCDPFLRARLRVHQAPGVPHALWASSGPLGGKIFNDSGAFAPRDANCRSMMRAATRRFLFENFHGAKLCRFEGWLFEK
jgi:hypothetical protein